ncbi:uncharacterized protein E5676_scaffold1827G00180 [Cucumis melo var. makuwa]|uniref:CACTA en-spm transposon protein n=1 Tax=Cucumis melo var. makuwa TaxID=1194695 RepID=A0A5D3CM70_CUCMM|nr:uncharacterized protein E5676_scaffold1827G00180 [Cucumis melo var. makuwa]
MSPTYKRWIFHGDAVDLSPFLRSNSRFLGATFSNVSECREEKVNLRENIGVRDSMDDEMVEMIHDLHGPMFEECRRDTNEQDESDKISGMFPEIEEELYPGCLKFTSFKFLVKLMHIKRSGHVKGQGWGPRPTNARNETIQSNTKEANAQIAQLQCIVESRQATIEAILRRLSCQEATSNMERSSEQPNDSQQLW